MRKPKLLVVKPGRASDAVRERHGDFDRWFVEALGTPERISLAEVVAGERLPDFAAFDGVIVTGSLLSARQPEPWMVDVAARLHEHADAGGALLGVCFGHQLAGLGLGERVVANPKGRELGTVRVQLTQAGRRDALFDGLDPVLEVQAFHEDAVAAVPAGATLLASNERCAVQALSFGLRARSVQFHPEATAAIVRTVLESDGPLLAAEGFDVAAAREGVHDSGDGRRILRNFEELLAGR